MPLRIVTVAPLLAAGLALSVAGSAQAATGSFPPFEPSTFASQLFWLAITFGGLYWMMSTIALPRVEGILKDRADKIAGDLASAAQMQARAEETAAAYEKALTEARKNAQGIAQKAREAGAKASDARRKTVEAELVAKLAAAETQIATTKSAAMANVRSLGSEVAIAIVAKLTGQAPSPAEADGAVDQALAQG